MSEVIAEYKVKVDKAVSDLNKVADEWQDVDKASVKAGVDGQKAIQGVEKSTKSLLSTLKNVAGAIGIAFGVKELISFGKEAVTVAAKAEGIKKAFDKLNSPNLLADLRKATRGTVSDLDLMQKAVQANNFKLPLDKLAQLFQFATNRAIETGESVDYLVESIVLGISRKSIPILDNLGISSVQIQEEMKKTGDFAQAAFNIIENEGNKAGVVMDTTSVKLAQLTATWDNFTKSVGDSLIRLGSFGLKLNEINELLSISNSALEKRVESTAAAALATVKLQEATGEEIGTLKQLRIQLFGLNKDEEDLIRIYEESKKVKQDSVEKTKEEIRNVFFLQKAIADLKEEQKAEGTTRERILAINGKLIPLEEELAILLGKETEAMKERRKELEKWEKVVKEAIDLDDTDFEKNIDKWTEAQIKAYRKLQEERAKVTATELSALDELVDVRIGLIEDESEREIAAVKNTLAQKLAAIEGNSVYENELRFALAEEAENRITEIQKNAQEKRNSESLDQWNQYSSAVQGAVAAISSFSMAVTDQELSNLELRLSQGEITREEYDKKRKVILEQQAEDQKAAALFQATIDGISAVVNAYSEGGPILAAVVGVAVAAEIAAIAAAPLPTFKEGGMVKEHGLLKGKSHAQGGIKVEAEGNEYFMPTKPTLKNYGLLEAMRKGVEEQYILKHYKGRFIDDAIFNGFADIGKSAELNNLTVNFKDHNLIHSDDKTRSTIRNGFKFLAKELKKENNSKRGGYRA
jgi:hypothetical protein